MYRADPTKPQNHHTAAKDTKSTPYVELALN
jgi:hypothetical protein